jgi:hypothetical protein
VSSKSWLHNLGDSLPATYNNLKSVFPNRFRVVISKCELWQGSSYYPDPSQSIPHTLIFISPHLPPVNNSPLTDFNLLPIDFDSFIAWRNYTLISTLICIYRIILLLFFSHHSLLHFVFIIFYFNLFHASYVRIYPYSFSKHHLSA